MIGSLRGRLLEWGPGSEVLVEVAGIGYRVAVTPRTLAGLGSPGDEIFLYVHHHQREDGQALYGFASRDERTCFETLRRATGVGPALALAISAVHTPQALRTAVAAGDLDAFCLVPGVGKKTAARLLIELKSRFDGGELDVVPVLDATSPHATAAANVLGDVRDALASLGYSPDEIRIALHDLGPDAPVDSAGLLREALARLVTAAAHA